VSGRGNVAEQHGGAGLQLERRERTEVDAQEVLGLLGIAAGEVVDGAGGDGGGDRHARVVGEQHLPSLRDVGGTDRDARHQILPRDRAADLHYHAFLILEDGRHVHRAAGQKIWEVTRPQRDGGSLEPVDLDVAAIGDGEDVRQGDPGDRAARTLIGE
jgi:hypothetical protein